MVVDGEALVGKAQVQRQPGRTKRPQGIGLGDFGPAEGIVGEAHPREAGICGLEVGQLVAQLTGKQQAVVLLAYGIALWQPWDGPIEAVAEEDQIVRAGQLVRQLRHLWLPVVLVQVERVSRVTVPVADEVWDALFPVLLQYYRAFRDVAVDPVGRPDGRVGLAIHRDVGGRVEGCAPYQQDQPYCHGPAERQAQIRSPCLVPEVEQHPGAEQEQERRDRREVSQELHLERARNQEGRHDPGEQQHVASGLRRAQRQRPQ